MIRDLADDPEFQKLSPAQRGIVIDKMAAGDREFSSLSKGAQESVRKRLVGGTPQPTKPDPWTPYVEDQAKKGAAGTFSLPGFIADMGTVPLNLGLAGAGAAVTAAGRPDLAPELYQGPFVSEGRPTFGGTRQMYEANSRNFGVEDVPLPKDEYGKPARGAEFAGGAANFLGATIVPSLVVAGLSESAIATLATELAGAAVSGLSAVEFKKYGKMLGRKFGLDEQKSERFGEDVGALFGPALIAKGAAMISRGAGAVSRDAQTRAGQVAASSDIRKALESYPEHKQNLRDAADVSAQIPGYKPILADATGAPGIPELQRKLAGEDVQTFAAVRGAKQRNEDAISSFTDMSFPKSSADITRPIANLFKARTKDLQKQREVVDARIEKLTGSFPVDEGAQARIGEKLRELRDQQENIVRAEKNARYQDVYDRANQLGIKEDMSDVRDMVNGMVSSDAATFEKASNIPSSFARIQSRYGAVEKQASVDMPAYGVRRAPASFEEMHSLYKNLNQDIGQARIAASRGDPSAVNRLRYLGQVKVALGEKLAKYEGAQYGDFAGLLKGANEFYVNKYKAVFKQGLGGKMARETAMGDVTADEHIVRKLIFQKGSEQGMKDFFEIYGDDPQAGKLLENGITDIFAKAVVRNGEIKPGAVEAFVRDHNDALSMVPELKAKISDVDKLNDALLQRRKVIDAERQELTKTKLAKIYQSENPEKLFDASLGDRKTMLLMFSQTRKSPDMKQEFSRGVVDAILRKPDPFEYLSKNKETLKPIMDALGPNHYKNLDLIARASRIERRSELPRNVAPLDIHDPVEALTGTTGRSIAQQSLAVAQGRQSKLYMAVNTAGRFIYKIKIQERDNLLRAAMTDPELAQSLLNIQLGKQSKAYEEQFRRHLWAHGIRLESQQIQQQNEQTPEKAKQAEMDRKRSGIYRGRVKSILERPNAN